jgi:hypothetical protein
MPNTPDLTTTVGQIVASLKSNEGTLHKARGERSPRASAAPANFVAGKRTLC